MSTYKHIIRWGAVGIVGLAAGWLVFVFGVVPAFTTFAISGPGSAPGLGGGLLNIDSGSGDLSIGGSADNTSKLLIKSGGSTSGTFGLRVTDSSNNNLLIVRSDGVVTIASTTNVASAGIHFSDGTVQTSAYTGSASNPTTIAGNVASGAFGSNTGGGNYSFPASVGIGTVSPVAADGSSRTLQLLNTVVMQNVIGIQALYANNAYYDGAWKFVTTAGAEAIRMNGDSGQPGISFHVAASGAAGSTLSTWDTTDIKMRINQNGNVGIGTASPSAKLDVRGAIYGGDSQFYNSVSLTNGFAGDVQSWIWAGAANQLDLGVGPIGNTQIVIKSTGNVGIGTTGPDNKLDVSGGIISHGSGAITSSNAGISMNYDGTTGLIETWASKPMGFNTAGVRAMTILTSGNIGIGTTAPLHKLDVGAVGTSVGSWASIAGNTGIGAASGNKFLYLYNDGTNIKLDAYDYGASSALSFNLGGNGGDILLPGTGIWKNSGNVGIGTTAPISKLANTASNITDDYSGVNSGGITWYTSQADTYAMAIQNDHIYGGGLLIKAGNDKNPTRRLLNVTNGDNTSRFFVRGDGNVGIGTTGPGYKLDVAGVINSSTGGFRFPDGTTQTTAFAGGSQTVVAGNVGAGTFGSNTGGGNYTFPASVGIGIPSPGYNLDVNGTMRVSGARFYFGDASYGVINRNTASADLYFGETADTGRYIFRSSGVTSFEGNVGIGTPTPGYKLQVTQSAAGWTIHANGTGGYGLLGSGSVYAGYFQGPVYASGNVSAASFTGNGAGLTGVVPAAHNHSGDTLRNAYWQPTGSASDDFYVDVEPGTRVMRTRNWNASAPNIAGTGIHTGSGQFETTINAAGVITGSSFSGAGTGLTGTAASLTAGNASAVNGQVFSWANNNNNPTYLWAADSNGSAYLAARGGMSVLYASTAGGAPPTGAASGVLAGTYPSPSFASNVSYPVAVGDGNGLKFWGGADTYKISMGNAAEYHYGPVTDYSIKTSIDSVNSTRGFTWGVTGVAPVAAINVGNGNMQIAGNLSVGGGGGKITVGTVDPLYTIGGEQYATYLPGMVGQKEETAGETALTCSDDVCSAKLDFTSAPKGSDLWLFAHAVNLKQDMTQLTAILTPLFDGRVWYTKDVANLVLTIFGSSAKKESQLSVSYLLIAPRFDSAIWTNYNHVEGATGLTPPNW